LSSRITIITGERSVGKSTLCRKLCNEAQARGYTCAGIITLRHPNERLAVLDIRTGEQRQLTTSAETGQVTIQGRFKFDTRTIVWANQALIQAVPSDLLVVDELGPLEFNRRQGWIAAFDILEQADYALALVVIRPELLTRAQFELPSGPKQVVAVTPENRDDLLGPLLDSLRRQIPARE